MPLNEVPSNRITVQSTLNNILLITHQTKFTNEWIDKCLITIIKVLLNEANICV